jgi:hypothetical protein
MFVKEARAQYNPGAPAGLLATGMRREKHPDKITTIGQFH